MVRRALLLASIATIAFAPNAALAHTGDLDDRTASMRTPINGVQLAQMGEIDIYYDKFGREVLVDSRTGEVISVEPRRVSREEWRRSERRQQLRRQLEDDDYERYEDGVQLERPRLRPRRDDYDNRRFAPPLDDFSDETDLDQFPEAPRGNATLQQEEGNRPANRATIERKPLQQNPTVKQAPSEETVDTVINEPADGTDQTSTATTSPTIAVDTPGSLSSRPEVANLQVLLDRMGASPGVIDGRFGSNVDKALAAYRELTGDNLKSTDTEGIKKRLSESGGDAFANYEITAEDAAGPYVASVPEDYSEKAKLERMSFTSVTEALAERFHMDEAYLKALNPEANFNRPGTIIRVANFGRLVSTPVAHIVADKGRKQVRAYDEAGKLVAAYPATIGSSDTPSPTGNHAVSRIAFNPNYTYNPKINFQQGANTQVLTIPPGPNGPVGSIWIALDKPTYGIHGTPEPSKIGKTESHGCVRLTNWDADELAKLVKPGVVVEFVE